MMRSLDLGEPREKSPWLLFSFPGLAIWEVSESEAKGIVGKVKGDGDTSQYWLPNDCRILDGGRDSQRPSVRTITKRLRNTQLIPNWGFFYPFLAGSCTMLGKSDSPIQTHESYPNTVCHKLFLPMCRLAIAHVGKTWQLGWLCLRGGGERVKSTA